MSKLLASFKNKENALALSTALRNSVKNIWVCIFTPTESNPYYDVDVQNANDAPCSEDQLLECENIIESLILPIPDDIVISKDQESLDQPTTVASGEGVRL